MVPNLANTEIGITTGEQLYNTLRYGKDDTGNDLGDRRYDGCMLCPVETGWDPCAIVPSQRRKTMSAEDYWQKEGADTTMTEASFLAGQLGSTVPHHHHQANSPRAIAPSLDTKRSQRDRP